MKKSQEHQILEHLKAQYSITHLEAERLFGCSRLAARIADLRKQGWRIMTEMITRNGKRFAEYYLERPWTQDEYDKRQEDARDIEVELRNGTKMRFLSCPGAKWESSNVSLHLAPDDGEPAQREMNLT